MIAIKNYPQWRTPIGIKKPLLKPATADMTWARRNGSGMAQMRAMRRAIQVWFRAILTTTT